MSIKLIVGLANPGSEYAATRHNAGEWFVEALLSGTSDPLKPESKFFASLSQTTLDAHPIRIMVPTTYMNESGKAIAAVCNFYKVEPQEILVAHDELDLPPGTVRLKQGGGHGGHNGLRHIIQALGTPNFYRLRIGIGHPGNKNQVTNYVLKKPSTDDKNLIDDAITQALHVIPTVLAGDMQKAMTALHTE